MCFTFRRYTHAKPYQEGTTAALLPICSFTTACEVANTWIAHLQRASINEPSKRMEKSMHCPIHKKWRTRLSGTSSGLHAPNTSSCCTAVVQGCNVWASVIHKAVSFHRKGKQLKLTASVFFKNNLLFNSKHGDLTIISLCSSKFFRKLENSWRDASVTGKKHYIMAKHEEQ